MKRLEKVSTPPDYIDRYDAIVAAKKQGDLKDVLNDLRADVATRYALYETTFAANSLHTVPEDTHMQSYVKELQHCYKSSTKPLRKIYQDIRDAQFTIALERCPYCGITLPQTHDHYLPEGLFPEFSAHALNLVPCCDICNSTKGNRWIENHRRIFAHFYLDSLPNDQYLHVQINSIPGRRAFGATFSLVRPPTITDNGIWRLIESHFNKLSLLDRYKDKVNGEISVIFGICVDHLRDGGNGAAGFLIRQADRTANNFGSNHWRVVLMNALASEQNFINLVVQEV